MGLIFGIFSSLIVEFPYARGRATPNHTYIYIKGCRMGRSDKVSLLYVAWLINTRFRFFILE